MKKILLAFLGSLVLATLTQAAGPSATVSWTMPDKYTDGSSLPASDILSTTIQVRRPGSTTLVGAMVVLAPATSTVVNGLVCGNYEFVAFVTTKSTSAQPGSSDNTNPVAYAPGVSCKPNPPTGLTVS